MTRFARQAGWLAAVALTALLASGCEQRESPLPAAVANLPMSDSGQADVRPAPEARVEPVPAETVETSHAAAPVRPTQDQPEAAEPAEGPNPPPSETEPAVAQPEAQPASSPPAAPAPADDGTVKDITFDTIKLDMKKEDPWDRALVTPQIEALSGKNIRIRGFILPQSVFTQTGVTAFVLVRDNMECCFGPGALLHDCILVSMNPGKSTDFTTRPIAVEGKFRIEELQNPLEPDGNPMAIYQMSADAVE